MTNPTKLEADSPMPEDRSPGSPARLILALGLFSIVVCQITGPVAWIWGELYLRKCRRERRMPEKSAVRGRNLGIVGTVLLGLLAIISYMTYEIIFELIKWVVAELARQSA